MRFKLYDVWQAFLACMIDWFNRRKPEDPVLSMLRLELEYAHIEKEILVRALSEATRPKFEEVKTEEQTNFMPIGKETWQARARRLTAESIQRRKEMEAEHKAATQVQPIRSVETIEDLEKELAVGDSDA